MSTDPLDLAALFAGGAEPWWPKLGPVIAQQPSVETFLSPGRAETIVPVRELTFQALKPNPAHRWKVVVFGQNPYPRVESATGIAMFDNAFRDWADVQFGRATSIRCLVKAATMWKLGLSRDVSVADLRAHLASERTLDPPRWFSALLAQGVLLLNVALTASTDDGLSIAQHTAFWKPIIEQIVRGILADKAASPDPLDRSVVFAWWGAHARMLRRDVEAQSAWFPHVRVVHVDHVNPAAMADAFCDGDPLGAINLALEELGAAPVDWLPSEGWDGEDASRMSAFVTGTMESHQQYMERLQSVAYERDSDLPAITGLLSAPALPFDRAVNALVVALPNVARAVDEALVFARAQLPATRTLTADEIAALHLYTNQTLVFRALNAALRDPTREKVPLFGPYLRLLLAALAKLPSEATMLYRGVSTDLRGRYPIGREVVWWGVSSCTSNPDIARKFLGTRGRRTLFEITPRRAVPIRAYSKFQGQDEYVLPPGTALRVEHVVNEPGGLSRIELVETEAPRRVC